MMSSSEEHQSGLGAACLLPTASSTSLAKAKIDVLAMYAPPLRGSSRRPCEASETDDATIEKERCLGLREEHICREDVPSLISVW